MSNCELKILIIDSSELVLKMIEEYIRCICSNAHVFATLKPCHGMEIIKKEQIEILILDTSLENVGGLDLLKQIKEHNGSRTTIVLMLSSLMDNFTVERNFEYEAIEYLQKPIDEIGFKLRLKAIIHTRWIEKESIKHLDMLRKQNKELKELNQQLANTEIQLIQKEKLAAIGQLAAAVAHEIDSPLDLTITNLNLLYGYITELKELIGLYSQFERMTNRGDLNDINKAREALYNFENCIHPNSIHEESQELYHTISVGLDLIAKIVKNLRNFTRLNLMNELER